MGTVPQRDAGAEPLVRGGGGGGGGGGGKGEAPRSWSFFALLVAAFCRHVCT